MKGAGVGGGVAMLSWQREEPLSSVIPLLWPGVARLVFRDWWSVAGVFEAGEGDYWLFYSCHPGHEDRHGGHLGGNSSKGLDRGCGGGNGRKLQRPVTPRPVTSNFFAVSFPRDLQQRLGGT